MKTIKPNDLGQNKIVEWCQKIRVEDYIRQASKDLKKRLIESELEINNIPIKLGTSKTRFGGERFWFICPICQKRIGNLFQINNQIACRTCLKLKYKAQNFSKIR